MALDGDLYETNANDPGSSSVGDVSLDAVVQLGALNHDKQYMMGKSLQQ